MCEVKWIPGNEAPLVMALPHSYSRGDDVLIGHGRVSYRVDEGICL